MPADWRPREWLWVTGYRETDIAGNGKHRQTASWWRYVWDTEWTPIPGRPLGNGPGQPCYPEAEGTAPPRAKSMRNGTSYTDENGEGTLKLKVMKEHGVRGLFDEEDET